MSHHNLRTRQVPRVTHNINQRGRGRRPPVENHVFDHNTPTEANGNLIDLNGQPIGNPTAPRVQTGPTGRLCDVFTGQDPLVLVEDWMALFEMATDFSTDLQRKALLSRHVSNEAMQWLVREIAPIRATLTWAQVKTAINRFKRTVHNHLEQAMDRVLKEGETIQAYFLEKRRLLDLAGQTQENQIALLTRGLPSKLMKAQVAASRPRTTADWLEIALAVENTLKTNEDTAKPDRKSRPARVNHINDQGNTGQRGQFRSGQSHSNRSDSNQNPNTPCPVCRLFGQREFHWKRNCPRLRPVNESSGSSTNSRPQRPSGTTGTDSTQASTSANQAAPANLVVTRPELIHIDLTINNRHVVGLLDTGSTITAISRTVAERLGLTWDVNRSIPLQHVDGEARTLGAITLPIGINGHFHRVNVHVLERLASDCLIGVDLAHLARLDIQFGREQFRCWLDGATFTLRTDCSCLTWLFKLDHTNSRLHRWCIRLSAFDFIPTHIAGKTNVAADALSRFPVSFFTRVSEARAITEFPIPTSVKAVRSFVGLANFYRQFIPNFSVIVKPLTDLTRKDHKFEWTEEAEESFQHLNKLLSSRPILHTFDPKLHITVTTDASQVGIGCVVTQSCEEEPLRTIAFWSAKLDETESRYSNVERECLAVVRSFEQFRCWLDGATFTLRTDRH